MVTVEDPTLAPSRLLRAGVVLSTAALVWTTLRHGSALNGLLFMGLGAPEEVARKADFVLASLAGLSALSALLGRHPWTTAIATCAAFLVAAGATASVGGQAFAKLAPIAAATKWLAPLALPALAAGRPVVARRILACACALTFATHGLEALGHHPAFVDLLLGSSRRWLDLAPRESTARAVLSGIGTMDLAIAAGLLLGRWRWLAAWAALWGTLTALSRTVALGPEFLFETLLRSLNGLAPLALWYLLRPVLSDGNRS
ncbi:hypothetical protein [Engelhardtia mirabilis]|uniref:DoxX n=1 Tax=Engelhardtia mirabilis TaxID=2528011 RepID=A0A518BKH7_9BACT|nr:hypothetical protein Pla133_25590 [Planctomycetes bacterium Pla133]QDV01802.1 hypothetical protein Pla86_25580 [Planctomycetes bacterium Pla86]